MVPCRVVREVLHKHLEESLNKTSRACQRRIHYILKDPHKLEQVKIKGQEVLQDRYVHTTFPRPGNSLIEKSECYRKVFPELVNYLLVKFQAKQTDIPSLPDSLEEFTERFEIDTSESFNTRKEFVRDCSIKKNIQHHVAQTLYFSYLHSKGGKESYVAQFHKAYGQFHTQQLYDALLDLKQHGMVAGIKKLRSRGPSTQMCVPGSSWPFKLSNQYENLLSTSYQKLMLEQAKVFMNKLEAASIGNEEADPSGGLPVPLMTE